MATSADYEPIARKRVIIYLSDEEHEQLHQLAHRCKSSPSRLAHLGIAQLLVSSRETLPLLPASDPETAEIGPGFYDIAGA